MVESGVKHLNPNPLIPPIRLRPNQNMVKCGFLKISSSSLPFVLRCFRNENSTTNILETMYNPSPLIDNNNKIDPQTTCILYFILELDFF